MATQAGSVDREQPVRVGSQTPQIGRNQTVFASVHGHAQAIVVTRPSELNPPRTRPL